MSPLLSALAVLMIAAAIRERVGQRGRPLSEDRRRMARRVERLAGAIGVGSSAAERRIARAGVAGRISPAGLLATRAASALLALPPALVAAPVAPGRLGILVTLGLPLAALFAPDAMLDRLGSKRRAGITEALPEALDLMAVGAMAGRGCGPLLADAARGSAGPLRAELADAVAAIECGSSQEAVLRELRRSGGGPELASLAATLERSRRHGSPLTRGLREQSRSLRQDQRRRTGERATKAAPKIQLVVALLLVPSVLLIVAAAVLAGSDSLLTVL